MNTRDIVKTAQALRHSATRVVDIVADKGAINEGNIHVETLMLDCADSIKKLSDGGVCIPACTRDMLLELLNNRG